MSDILDFQDYDVLKPDQATSETPPAQLKKASGRSSTHGDILIELAAHAGLFHSPGNTAFVDLEINDHRETWPVRSRGFRQWLTRRFFEATGGAPGSEALKSALGVIEARAHFDAPERTVNVRVAGHDDKIYLDLSDDAWRAVEIDEAGWRIVADPPVRFRRAAGMRSLPAPVRGGSIRALRPYLNVASDSDFMLIVAWILAALRNAGPYPIVALTGEQGTAKTTFCAIARSLIDPNVAPLRALPREERDLFIAANNGHILAFDNVSHLTPWISDTLCRLATGGGFAVRQLFTDQDEVLFDASRPVMLNGIEDIVNRPDLADRAIFLNLEPIPENRRRPEKELWAAFEKARPQILGALLDAVSLGVRELPNTRLERLPRMADFALWATACEGAVWQTGLIMQAYGSNRNAAIDSVLEADPVGSAVRSLMSARTDWKGTASDLLGTLSEVAGEKTSRTKSWPATARSLSGRLRRAATFLRKIGINIIFAKEGRTRTRTIEISWIPENMGTEPSAPSAPSANSGKGAENSHFSATAARTQTARADAKRMAADANGMAANHPTVHEKPNDFNGADGADGADAKIPLNSSDWEF